MPHTDILVVVHPGSACGSADFNLGRYDAQAARDGLILDLDAWTGPIVVIDGSLSDELGSGRYQELGEAINKALRRAKSAGLLAERIYGCDSEPETNQQAAAGSIVRYFDVASTSFTVTGCWYDPSDEEGCVNSVADVFLKAGFRADVRDSAVAIQNEPEEELHEEEGMDCGM